MAELPRGERGRDSVSERAHVAAQELWTLLQEGAKVSPELARQIMGLLKVQELERRKESERGTVWEKLKNVCLQAEIKLLSVEEREFIDQMSKSFAQEVTTFEAIVTKAIGAKAADRDDYRSVEMRRSPKDYTVEQLDMSFGAMKNENVLGALHKQPDNDMITLLPYPGDTTRVVLRIDLITPQDGSEMDNRRTPHRYIAVAPAAGNFVRTLQSAVHLRDLPFILRNGAIAIDPRLQAFFDAPLSGSEFLGKAANPITLLDCTTARISHVEDTRQDNKAVVEPHKNYDSFGKRAGELIESNRPQYQRRRDSPDVINIGAQMPKAKLGDSQYKI